MKRITPLVSVIMPAYNAENYLKAAVESILSQTFTDFEFIIIDDHSTDSTGKILKSFSDPRIKIYRNQKNLGVAGSLNRALSLAKGKYIARMDADDISLPSRLQKQVNYLNKNKKIVAVGCQIEIINETDKVIGVRNFPLNPQKCHDYLMLTVPIQHPTLMARSETYKAIGYTSEFKTAEDWDLYFKLLKFGGLCNLHEILYSYRQLWGSNGFKNIKKAFLLITKIRLNAIFNLGYKPAWLMLLLNIIQALVVLLLPERTVFELFNIWRVNKMNTMVRLSPSPR